MAEASLQSLQDLFNVRGQIASDILKLQLIRLPHPKLIMLYERAEELRKGLEEGMRKATLPSNSEMAESLRETVQELCRLLEELRKKTADELSAAERQVGYVQFPLNLARHKKEARDLAARMAKAIGNEKEATVLEQFGPDWAALSSAVRRMGNAVVSLNTRVEPQVTAGVRNLDRIFAILDKFPDLAGIRREVRVMLNEAARRSIKDFNLFDPQFYADKLPGKGLGLDDLLTHYLEHREQHAPHPFFCPEIYRKTYAEVSQLRYSALEHFVRYGEVMYYSPGPDFDTMYYLENNEDVLDAGIPPLRHFLQHGLREGRPPCPKAGWFFTKRYLQPTGVRLGFVGGPEDSVRAGWEQFRSHCAKRKGGHADDIPSETWSGRETSLNAFVVGAEGVARLQGELLRLVAESDCRVLYIGDNPQADLDGLLHQDVLPLERLCAITSHYERFLRWQESDRPLVLRYYNFNDLERDVPFVEALLNRLADGQDFALRKVGRWGTVEDSDPAISVVTIIYKKSKEMKAFLEALNRQDLARPYEVVLVDDASPDNSVEQIEEWLEEKRSGGLLNAFMSVRILRNPTNSGNCTSRNRGVEAARADIVLVADGDVVMSTSSLSEHLWAYRLGDCDAVIGFFKFNMDYHDVFQWLAACETNPEIVKSQILIDSDSYIRPLPNSIYNFVTRNTSFKKSAFDGRYFDESFNYTSDINSGYGEEDHEISARLYFNQKNIRFVENSICVHIRHGDNSYNADKVVSNLRNWNRLIDKHPDLLLVDRQYYQWRTRNLLLKTSEKNDAPEVQNGRKRYQDSKRANIVVPQIKPLRILTYRCDVPYQYDLFKMRHFFTLVEGIEHCDASGWDHGLRPLPYNVNFARLEDLNPANFDLAILPFDSGILFRGKEEDTLHVWAGRLLRMLEVTKDIPQIALCHPAPMPLDGYRPAKGSPQDTQRMKRQTITRSLLQGVHVVCTSHQLQQEWGFTKSSVIWQGFSPQEYPEGEHMNGCLTLPPEAFQRDGVETLRRLRNSLSDVCPLECLDATPANQGHRDSDHTWAVANYQSYARYLGKFVAHLAPIRHAEMPRSLVEAMLTGTLPITLGNKDVDMFIRNGVNGFSSNSIDELLEHVRWVSEKDDRRRTISRQARLNAMDIFNVDRCLAAWLNLIRHIA
jgi:glycosyltransferase involved in cell wall biosynthesis